MKVLLTELGDTFEGTPAEIVRQMADHRWAEMEKHDYMRAAAKRARIYTGRPIRPWSAELFLKDLQHAELIEITE